MSNAGRSAFQMARKLRWQIHPMNLYRNPIIVIGVLSAIVLLTHGPIFTFVPLVLAFWFWCLMIRHDKSQFIVATKKAQRNWQTGAKSERKTARKLKWWVIRGRLRGEFRAVLNDRKVPESNANLDHIVVSRHGVMHWDTKDWTKPFEMREFGLLYYSGKPVSVSSTEHETKALQTALNRKFRVREELQVASFWAIRTPRRLPFDVHSIGDVDLLHVRNMTREINRYPKVMNNAMALEVFGYLSEKFPPARTTSLQVQGQLDKMDSRS